MADLAAFPVTRKWPARHPDRIQLYSLPTPNGVKASTMLEETGLPYEPHLVDFDKHDQTSPEFLSLNPNNKIPAIIDPDGPGGAPLPLFESGAILIYLADKSGRFLPAAPAARYECLQWLFFQVGHIGPMFGQLGSADAADKRTEQEDRPTQLPDHRCVGLRARDVATGDSKRGRPLAFHFRAQGLQQPDHDVHVPAGCLSDTGYRRPVEAGAVEAQCAQEVKRS